MISLRGKIGDEGVGGYRAGVFKQRRPTAHTYTHTSSALLDQYVRENNLTPSFDSRVSHMAIRLAAVKGSQAQPYDTLEVRALTRGPHDT